MKKLFALFLVAGSIAMFSCGEKKAEGGNTDTTKMSTEAVEQTPAESTEATAGSDTTKKDTSSAQPTEEKAAEKK